MTSSRESVNAAARDVERALLEAAMGRLAQYPETRYGTSPYIVPEQLGSDIKRVLAALQSRLDAEAEAKAPVGDGYMIFHAEGEPWSRDVFQTPDLAWIQLGDFWAKSYTLTELERLFSVRRVVMVEAGHD